MNDSIPTIIKELAEDLGYNSVKYLGELDGSSVFGGGFIGKNGLPVPTGLPELILLKDGQTKVVSGEEGLNLSVRLFSSDTDDAKKDPTKTNLMSSEKHTSKAPIFAIDRLRMGTDGPGITTLVCFMGCPLKCAYCLNDRCHEPVYENDGTTLRPGILMFTPQELYERVKIDNLYFQATGGGICFGGGEPTLYGNFIKAFRKICGNAWKITIETSLECSRYEVFKLSSIVDHWIVDVKDIHDSIYEAYTGKASNIKSQLELLRKFVPNENIKVRVPLIPDYNNEQLVNENIDTLNQMGFNYIQTFRYLDKNQIVNAKK